MITNDTKIAVLLATYNGEDYIEEQLSSLLKQTFQDFTVYIHDDGSSDATLNILKYFCGKYFGKIVLLEDVLKHRGAKNSFFWLLQEVDSSYYMFCDQDDVWLPWKIEETYARMLEVEQQVLPSAPVLIHTDLIVVDKNLNTLHISLWKYQHFKVDISKHYNFILQGNVVTGCTILINNNVKRYAFPFFENIAMHDWWLAIISAKYGIVENLKRASILYRQHESNVCGSHYVVRSFKKRIDDFIKVMNDRRELLKYLSYSYSCFIFYKFVYYIAKKLR